MTAIAAPTGINPDDIAIDLWPAPRPEVLAEWGWQQPDGRIHPSFSTRSEAETAMRCATKLIASFGVHFYFPRVVVRKHEITPSGRRIIGPWGDPDAESKEAVR